MGTMNTFQWLKYSQVNGFEDINLESLNPGSGDGSVDDDAFIEALGFIPTNQVSQDGLSHPVFFSGCVNVYHRNNEAKHNYPFLAVLPDESYDVFIVVESGSDLMALRVALAPLILLRMFGNSELDKALDRNSTEG